MGFHEFKWLKCNLNKPKFNLRYIDQILAAFDNEQDFFLNNRHPNIKFIPSLFLMYSLQVSIIKIAHFKHITN